VIKPINDIMSPDNIRWLFFVSKMCISCWGVSTLFKSANRNVPYAYWSTHNKLHFIIL